MNWVTEVVDSFLRSRAPTVEPGRETPPEAAVPPPSTRTRRIIGISVPMKSDIGGRRTLLRQGAAAILAVTVIGGLFSCETVAQSCQSLNLCDRASLSAVAVDVLCDASERCSCTLSSVDRTVSGVLSAVAGRPGSVVRLWTLGRRADQTRLVISLEVPSVSANGTRAKAKSETQFVENAKPALLAAIEPYLDQPPVQWAPVLGSIDKIALAAGNQKMPRLMLVLSNGRERSNVGDLACGSLPSAEKLAKRLRKRGILPPDSLADGSVHFVSSSAVATRKRCKGMPSKDRDLQALLAGVLSQAGARETRFWTTPPSIRGLVDSITTDSTQGGE